MCYHSRVHFSQKTASIASTRLKTVNQSCTNPHQETMEALVEAEQLPLLPTFITSLSSVACRKCCGGGFVFSVYLAKKHKYVSVVPFYEKSELFVMNEIRLIRDWIAHRKPEKLQFNVLFIDSVEQFYKRAGFVTMDQKRGLENVIRKFRIDSVQRQH